MKKLKLFLVVIIGTSVFISCNKDDDTSTTSELRVDLSGLEALGDDFVYEGWIIVDGNPISTGRFSSITFPQTYTVNADNNN